MNSNIIEVDGYTPNNHYYRIEVNVYLGTRNGYVGVLEGSPLFGIDYDLLSDFSVHGGLTYSGNFGEYIVGGENIWYFGFDCNHIGDGKIDNLEMKNIIDNSNYSEEDKEKVFNRYIHTISIYGSYKSTISIFPDDSNDLAKSKEYVKKECFSLSEQLEIEEKKLCLC